MAELRVVGAAHKEVDGMQAVVVAVEGGAYHTVYSGRDWLHATRITQRLGREIEATAAKLAVIDTETFDV